MSNSELTFDIVIPQYKNTWLLKRCLTSLSEIQFPENIAKVFVIENGGKYGVDDIVKEFESALPIVYSYSDEGNLSKARNQGIELSNSDVIIFFDNDMRFYQDTLTAYITTISAYGDKYFFGGALEPDYEEKPAEWLTPFLPNSAKGFSLGSEVIKHSKPDFLGGNHAFFRNHLIQFNGYDVNCASGDNEGAMGEETRLQQKLLEHGYKGVYIPNGRVMHYVPKKNCSKAWILKRAERLGITMAIQDREHNCRSFIGVPTYQLKLLIQNIMKLAIFFWSTELRFKALYKIRYQAGSITQYLKFYFNK